MESVYEKIRREKEEWMAKFNAATPEEQKEMLEKKNREREESEKRRKQMIYDDRKNRFFENCDSYIECYNLLKKAFPIVLEVTATFDGKVLNNRLTNAINEKLHAKVHQYVTATLTISYDYDLKNNVGKLVVKDYNHHDCDNEFSFRIILSPLSDSNRVKWDETLDDMKKPGRNPDDFERNIEKMKKAKKDYDKVFKKALKIYSIIEDYAKEDFHLRDFFKTEGIIGNTYYL